MTVGSMPGLAELIEFHKQKSDVIRGAIAHCADPRALDSGAHEMLQQAVGEFRPHQLCRERIPAAVAELKEIRVHTENSANTIMESAEQLMDSAMDEAVGIIEACTFQDIVGQRVGKVVGLLEMIATRLATLIDSTGVADTGDPLGEDDIEVERRRKEQILHGPQLAGEGISQDEIDALLGA